MMGLLTLPLVPWAVHIDDGYLAWPVLVVGFVVAGLLAVQAAWRIRDEEIPHIALLTAAFFVASSIHLKLGPTSTHLLLGGLVGVVLGRRAPLAILIGIVLQAALIPHGGFTTIGVNTCTEAIPALLAGGLFRLIAPLPWQRYGFFRGVIVASAAVVWAVALIFGAMLLGNNPVREMLSTQDSLGGQLAAVNWGPALHWIRHPAILAVIGVVAVLCALIERRMNNAPEFPLGLLLGVLSVLATAGLTGGVLLVGAREELRPLVAVDFLTHLPLAVLEGLILGCTVSFLARTKPELLGLPHKVESPVSVPDPAPEGVVLSSTEEA